MWSLAIGTIAVGAIAVAVMEHRLLSAEWELRHFVTNSDLEYLLHVIPYFWLGLFILLVSVASQEFRQTKRGYKFAIGTIIIIGAGASLAVGSVLYAVNIGNVVDRSLEQHVPLYHKNTQLTLRRWHNPEQGRLVGNVKESPIENVFTVVDDRGKEWMIVMTTGTSASFTNVVTNTQVRILGMTTEQGIIASYILPAKIPRAHLDSMQKELIEARKNFLGSQPKSKLIRERISEQLRTR